MSTPTKYFEGLNPHLATTAPPMATLAATNAAKPLRSVSPRQPQTMPATMARNWKTTPFTLALLATFSGSMTMSFLPECGAFGAGTTTGQRDALSGRIGGSGAGTTRGFFATREGAPTAGARARSGGSSPRTHLRTERTSARVEDACVVAGARAGEPRSNARDARAAARVLCARDLGLDTNSPRGAARAEEEVRKKIAEGARHREPPAESTPVMEPALRAAVEAVHASPLRAVMHVTGGGAQSVGWIAAVPGASRTLIDARVPYARESMADALGAGPPAQFVSASTARDMAVAANRRGARLCGGDRHLVGLGCTTARSRRNRPSAASTDATSPPSARAGSPSIT